MTNTKVSYICKFCSDLKLNQMTIRKGEIMNLFKGDNKRIDSIDFLEKKHSTKECHSCIQMAHQMN